jgi:predicted CXXCH cytochrome family protein
MKMQRFLVALITLLTCGAASGKDSCFDCHRVMEGTSLRFTNDVHFANALSCANCHGGDSNETNQNIAMSSSRGFKVRVTRQGVPEFCGRCHSDADFMAKYKPEPRVDQLAKYQTGVHGKLLPTAGRRRVAECVDCHGVHNTRAVSDPLSTASPQRVSQTCGKCHASTLALFAKTEHGELFTTKNFPGCTVCHSAHDTAPATAALLTGPNSCTRCHQPGTRPAKLAADMAQILADLEAAGPGSKDALARARVAVHSLRLDAVKKAAEPVPPDSNEK